LGDYIEPRSSQTNIASLDINPDEIEDERYAKAFCILFAIIEMLRFMSTDLLH
jgi:hypothetical protein